MATVTWGMLEKNQTDPETIEEAIKRLIAASDLLPVHKASEIIDHLAASIIADKIKDWEVVNLGGSFERNDFHWTTIFESIDGYTKSVDGTGSISVSDVGVKLITGATQDSTAKLSKSAYAAISFTWNKKRKVRFPINFQSVTNLLAYIGTGSDPQVGNRNFVGFKIINNALWGVVNNGAGETLLNLGVALVATQVKRLSFAFEPGDYVEFFVEGVSKGIIESGLPTSTDYSHMILFAYIINNAAANKELWIASWDFWQEI